MNKKQKINQLNNQSGMTAADALMGLLIIIITIGVIAMVYTNLVIGARGVDRKTGATRIATNLLENIEMVYYEEVEKKLEELSKNNGPVTHVGNTYIINGSRESQEDTAVFDTKIPAGYTVEILIEEPEENALDLLKKITVKVRYNTNNNEENVALSKVIEKEQIRECNSPQFENEYLEQLGVSKDTCVMSYQSAENLTGKSIICPIKYNGQNYEIMTNKEEIKGIWYSYSNKQWARVLVLSTSEYNECINNSSKISEKLKENQSQKSYVWVPRFGVKSGGNLFGDTFFKYKNADLAILNSYGDGNNFMKNDLDLEGSIDWSNANGISFEENNQELVGKWCLYSTLESTSNVNELAYKLNQSQYGPLREY